MSYRQSPVTPTQGYAEPACTTAVAHATASVLTNTGLLPHRGTDTGGDPPPSELRKPRPKRALSASISRVPAGTLWAMRANTQEQPTNAPDSQTDRYRLWHHGPLLKRPAEALHSTPKLLRVTWTRCRRRLSRPFSRCHRRLGGRPWSCPGEDSNEAIAGTWARGPQ
jgi:hypothetical protein